MCSLLVNIQKKLQNIIVTFIVNNKRMARRVARTEKQSSSKIKFYLILVLLVLVIAVIGVILRSLNLPPPYTYYSGQQNYDLPTEEIPMPSGVPSFVRFYPGAILVKVSDSNYIPSGQDLVLEFITTDSVNDVFSFYLMPHDQGQTEGWSSGKGSGSGCILYTCNLNYTRLNNGLYEKYLISINKDSRYTRYTITARGD